MNKQSEKPRGLLSGKTVLLCVTGGIAAYKMPNVARMLKKLGCNVHVLMTQNATNFITATTFETLTANKCLIDTFDRNFEFSVEHVALAKQADLVLIAPATANVIGKIANGIADDMLTTTVMACTCKCLIAPAMNHNMYHNPIVQDNIRKLEHYGYEMIEPVRGMLANGDTGDGKLPSEEELAEYVSADVHRGDRTVAAVVDDGGDSVLRVIRRGVTAEPARRLLVAMLTRAGLARNAGGHIGEVGRHRLALLVNDALESRVHEVEARLRLAGLEVDLGRVVAR